jgi:hypothetical protein
MAVVSRGAVAWTVRREEGVTAAHLDELLQPLESQGHVEVVPGFRAEQLVRPLAGHVHQLVYGTCCWASVVLLLLLLCRHQGSVAGGTVQQQQQQQEGSWPDITRSAPNDSKQPAQQKQQ